MKPWVGFDLDGTLAEYTEWKGPTHIGKPIPKMVDLAKRYEKEGIGIKISQHEFLLIILIKKKHLKPL